MPRNLDHIDPGNSGGSVPIPELPKIPPRPVTYPCAECSEVFRDIESLRRHRLDNHPLLRPYLYLAGRSHHLDYYVVTRQLTATDLHLINVETVKIDGGEHLDAHLAMEVISQGRSGRKKLELYNAGYSVDYILDFQLISDEVAQQVEEAFLESTRNSSSLTDCLIQFNDRVQGMDASSRGYAAALDRYLVGVMAKDRVKACQIPYEEYVEKLGESLDRLKHISRPFGDTLTSVIRLILNEYSPREPDQEIPLLTATVKALCEGELSDIKSGGDTASAIPVDEVTESAMHFATAGDSYRAANTQTIERLLQSQRISDSDRLKFHLLWMAGYGKSGDSGGLQRHFSKVRHVHRVADQAKIIFERYGQ